MTASGFISVHWNLPSFHPQHIWNYWNVTTKLQRELYIIKWSSECEKGLEILLFLQQPRVPSTFILRVLLTCRGYIENGWNIILVYGRPCLQLTVLMNVYNFWHCSLITFHRNKMEIYDYVLTAQDLETFVWYLTHLIADCIYSMYCVLCSHRAGKKNLFGTEIQETF